jgi:hypothetical protein
MKLAGAVELSADLAREARSWPGFPKRFERPIAFPSEMPATRFCPITLNCPPGR